TFSNLVDTEVKRPGLSIVQSGRIRQSRLPTLSDWRNDNYLLRPLSVPYRSEASVFISCTDNRLISPTNSSETSEWSNDLQESPTGVSWWHKLCALSSRTCFSVREQNGRGFGDVCCKCAKRHMSPR